MLGFVELVNVAPGASKAPHLHTRTRPVRCHRISPRCRLVCAALFFALGFAELVNVAPVAPGASIAPHLLTTRTRPARCQHISPRSQMLGPWHLCMFKLACLKSCSIDCDLETLRAGVRRGQGARGTVQALIQKNLGRGKVPEFRGMFGVLYRVPCVSGRLPPLPALC